ncbi:hypothetical protein PIIN_09521 [Serendipita indica DSM 11827]|uniref:F-box domain-containing protein n=1 Tax=Serendipita indica (strain DSM 11827) TaxID=1109443 RepID=G4U348_SERID|nr:hypothetical protein PIIN_09521 [Serendipita indica DSM 11827]
MPSLWTDVAFSLSTIKECKARELWSVIAPRTRQSLATIRIQHADSGRLTLAVCNLKVMRSIEKLALHVGDPSSGLTFLNREYTNLACRCRVLELYGGYSAPSCHVNLSIALYHFDGVEGLVIRGLGDVMLDVAPSKLASLTEITLKDLGEVRLIDIMREVKTLCNLICVRVDVKWEAPVQRFESGLKRLALIALEDYGWLFYVIFPALEIIEFMQTPSTSFSPFVSTLPKLKSLNCDIKQEKTILEMNRTSHRLERLVIHSDIVLPLFTPVAYNLTQPVFPNLSILELWLENLSIASLERLIYGRCLPRSHQLSLLPTETSLIATLRLYWKASPGEPVVQTVEDSELIASASRRKRDEVETYNGRYVRLTLGWTEEPVRLPDYTNWLSDIYMSAAKFYKP